MNYLYTRKAGAGTAHIVRSNPNAPLAVLIENKEGLSDYPIMDRYGEVLFDFPERFNQRTRTAARILWHAVKLARFAVDCTGWHTYASDPTTRAAVRIAQESGLITVNKFHQFKAI